MPYAIRLLVAACGLLVALMFTPAEARRVALVIGNSAYKAGPLSNPERDAAAVALTLEKQLKFDKVVLRQNLSYIGFRDALSEFSLEATGADMAVVYFAGHGVEAAGSNFLIPVDATPRRASDLDLQAIPLQTVLNQLEGVRALKLVILDACRDNPFSLPGAKRTVKRGFKRIEPDENTLVVYAAKDGTTADDGTGGRHSPFTEALLKHIATPRLDVRILFGRVRDEVVAATRAGQVPHYYGTLGGKEVYLREDGLAAPAVEKLPPPPPRLDKLPASRPPPEKLPAPSVVQKDKAPSPQVERPFDRIVGDVRLAVVGIDGVKPPTAADKSATDKKSPPDGLEDFFNKRFGRDGVPKPVMPASGLLISPDGYAVTAQTAIADAKSIKLRIDGKGAHEADVVGVDSILGIALLKIRQPGTWPFVALPGDVVKLGDPVFAMGSAFGLGGTALKGHVTGLDRNIGTGPYDYIQTDIAFPKDDFLGSPLFDMRGSVVGIVAAKGTGEKAAIVFALPARDVVAVVEQLKAHGTVKRGWLGVRIQSITDKDMAQSLGLSEAKGALVAEVQSPSPAAIAGIKRGDTILTVNGIKVADSRDLSRQIAELKPDTTVELKLMRAQKEQTVRVRLGLLPPLQELAKSAPAQPSWPTELSQLGISVAPLGGPRDPRDPRRAPPLEGVQITGIEPDAPIAQKVRVGDIILEADNRPVNSTEDLVAAIRDANRQNRRAILLLVKSGTETRFEPVALRRN